MKCDLHVETVKEKCQRKSFSQDQPWPNGRKKQPHLRNNRPSSTCKMLKYTSGNRKRLPENGLFERIPKRGPQRNIWGEPNPAYQQSCPRNWKARWHRGNDVELLYSHKTWAHCRHRVNNEVLCMPKNSDVKCEGICLTTKAWLKPGHAIRHWSQAHQQNLQKNGWNRDKS